MNIVLLVLYYIMSEPFQTISLNGKVLIDGPYVTYTKEKIYSTSIFEEGGVKSTVTDSFPIAEKKKYNAASGYRRAGKNISRQVKSEDGQ